MRHVVAAQFDTAEKQAAKSAELDGAWKALRDAGAAGAARLHQEIQALDASGERDDYFRLGACVVLWQIQGAREAPAIAEQWRSVKLFGAGYTYVFPLAMEAAHTHDQRVIPMLVALLHDDQATYIIVQHAMNLGWPNTVELPWSVFGPAGLAPLREVLANSPDNVARRSAAYLLALFADVKALPVLRETVRAPQQDARVRATAAHALGRLGHPDDFTLLTQMLEGPDPLVGFGAADALYEYGDLRAVPLLAARLRKISPADETPAVVLLRGELLAGLSHLTTEAGWQVLALHRPQSDIERQFLAQHSVRLKEASGVTWEEYLRLPAPKQAAVRAQFIAARDGGDRLRAGDRTLSRADFKAACADWISRNRITGGPFAWVEDRHIIASVDPADLDLLREVRGAVSARVSDEMIPELETLDRLIPLIARKAYRATIGVCEPVAAPVGPPKPH